MRIVLDKCFTAGDVLAGLVLLLIPRPGALMLTFVEDIRYPFWGRKTQSSLYKDSPKRRPR